MEKFFKHPATIITGIILAAVAGFFGGKSEWFQNLFKPSTTQPSQPSNGTPCKTSDGSDGKYNGGVCVKNVGIPDTNQNLRTSARQANAPATIQVWVGAPVPYTYMGCTYGKPYYIVFQGRRVMILTKLSCP